MSYNLLKGKRGIIFGALDENSIAWKTALKVKEEGGTFTLTNAPIAMRLGKINELAKACNAQVIPADATSEEDLKNLFNKSIEVLGGKIDFVLHSIGMSPNIRKGKEYGDMNYEWYLKTLDISALSFHKVMQTAEKLERGEHIVAFVRAERSPFHEWLLAVTAQIGPEDREVCGLVDLDAEIEEPRAIAAVTMQQHHSRRAFSAFEQPAATAPPVLGGPTFVSDLDGASADL